jgi:hypothetical protein
VLRQGGGNGTIQVHPPVFATLCYPFYGYGKPHIAVCFLVNVGIGFTLSLLLHVFLTMRFRAVVVMEW